MKNRLPLVFAVLGWLLLLLGAMGSAASGSAPPPLASDSPTTAPPAATAPTPAAAARTDPNIVERLGKVFRFAADPPEARAAMKPFMTPGIRPNGPPPQPRVLLMLPYYQANVPALRSGGLEMSRFLYYTYLVVNAVTDAGINEVRIAGNRVGSFSPDGSPAQALLMALEKLAAMPSVQAGSFEPRYFQFVVSRSAGGGVSMLAQGSAIWLRSPSGKDDLIYPLSASGADGMMLETLYPAEKFNALLQTALAKLDAQLSAKPATP